MLKEGFTMPKRTKIPDINNYPDYTSMGKSIDNLLVQKANPLQTLSKTSMTLPELKILDAYLSRINSHEIEKRYVRFEKGELERLLGVSRILRSDLEKRVNNLFQVLTIRDNNKEDGFTKIALFSKAECKRDKDGFWQVNLACSPEAMEYFFFIENIGYLKYRLKNVIELTSRYSYILYLHLEGNHIRKEWSIPLDDLRTMLNCTAETYAEYKEFNSKILKKCLNEINEKTSLKYEYYPIKKGRKVIAIKFSIITPFIELPEQVESISVIQNNEEHTTQISSIISKYFIACEMTFSCEELQQIQDIISTSKIPQRIIGEDSITKQYNYFVQMYSKFKIAKQIADQKEKPIRKPFDYFIKLIKNDIDSSFNKKQEPKIEIKEQSYDINEFDRFAVTFSENTNVIVNEEDTVSDEFRSYEKQISETDNVEKLFVINGEVSFVSKTLKDSEKEQLIKMISDKISMLG